MRSGELEQPQAERCHRRKGRPEAILLDKVPIAEAVLDASHSSHREVLRGWKIKLTIRLQALR